MKWYKTNPKGKAPGKARTGTQEMSALAQDIIRSVGVGIYIVQYGNFVYTSPLFLNLTGYSIEELLGRYSLNYVYPEDRGMVRKTAIQSLKGLNPLPYEYRFISKNGELIWVLEMVTSTMYRGERATVGSFMDITERKRIEHALQAIQKSQEALINATTSSTLLIDTHGTIIIANETMAQTFGKNLDELIGMNVYALLPPVVVQSRKDYVEQVVRTGKPAHFEDERFGRMIANVVYPVFDMQGKVDRLAVTGTDITELKQAENALRASEEKLQLMFESISDGVVLLDLDRRILQVNEATVRMLGYSDKDELVGQDAIKLASLKELSRALRGTERTLAAGIRNVEYIMTRKDGSEFSAELGAAVLKDANGSPIGFVVIFNDVTERKKAEAALQESEEKFRSLYMAMSEGVALHEIIYDESGKPVDYLVLDVNPVYEAITGFKREQVVGKKASEFTRDNIPLYVEAADKVVKSGVPVSMENYLPWADKHVHVSVFTPGKGKFVTVFTDITERKKVEQQLSFMATHDGLTDLPNRTLFIDRLTLALAHAQRSHHKLAVMMLDLDRFKDVNDTLGHDVGDKLLKDVSVRLAALLRKSDTVARMGGDEFMILLPEVAQADYIATVAQKILDGFHQPFVIGGHELHVTSSIGIAIYPGDGEEADALLKNADVAMYRAKELGRDKYQLFSNI